MDNNINQPITYEEFEEKYTDAVSGELDLTAFDGTDNRTERILALSDRLMDKISDAIGELTKKETKIKEKTKEVEYDAESKKPLHEVHTEKESAEIYDTLIDTGALKQLVSTLKDIKDIHTSLCADAKGRDEADCGVIVISGICREAEEQ